MSELHRFFSRQDAAISSEIQAENKTLEIIYQLFPTRVEFDNSRDLIIKEYVYVYYFNLCNRDYDEFKFMDTRSHNYYFYADVAEISHERSENKFIDQRRIFYNEDGSPSISLSV